MAWYSSHRLNVDLNRITELVVREAIREQIGMTEDDLLVRNVITHLDFNTDTTVSDKIVFSNKKENDKVICLYQFSYVPRDASPNVDDVRRPFSVEVKRNNNYVYSIQSVQTMNQLFEPPIMIEKWDNYTIEFDGYDGTAIIYLFGMVAERIGVNMNL